jgi:hypothetical protein
MDGSDDGAGVEVWSIWVHGVLAKTLFVYCPLRNW